jgi:hypothetical protein
MVSRFVQPEKAELPISTSPFGNPIDVSSVHPSKAHELMVTISSGIFVLLHPFINSFFAVSMIALQLLRESKTVFALSTVIETNALQPEKQE